MGCLWSVLRRSFTQIRVSKSSSVGVGVRGGIGANEKEERVKKQNEGEDDRKRGKEEGGRENGKRKKGRGRKADGTRKKEE